GVAAVDPATGKLVWESPSDWSFDRAADESKVLVHLENWVNAYLPANPHVLLENSALGALSSDGTRVFAVDDLPLPPFPTTYAVAEKDQDVRLFCLDADTGRVAWAQTLANNKARMVLDGGRRLRAAHVACAEGVLVCPTNAGGLFGVDLLSHSLLWAHAYAEE